MFSEKKGLPSMRQDAVSIFKSAIDAVQAETAIKRHCRVSHHRLEINRISYDLKRYENVYILGAGKASAHMAKAIEDLILPYISQGTVIVKYGHGVALEKIKVIEAGHPLPDSNGLQGARHILELCKKAGKNDLIIFLISGGGSALLPLPTQPLTLPDKQKTITALLACGASIDEINILRKHMSMIKGGRLAQTAYPAKLLSLIISDVIGDRLDTIASGPTVGDPSTFAECLEVIKKYQLADSLPPGVVEFILSGIEKKILETPKPQDPVFASPENFIVATNSDALSAAKKKAESLGYRALILSSMIDGNNKDTALFHVAIAKEISKSGHPLAPPACILSGGETTVTVTGKGLGGRNQEFALTAAMKIKNEKNMVFLCAGTDGTDGPTDAAGAIVDHMTVKNAKDSGIDPAEFLKNNDSYHFFEKTGNLFLTGPTGTNVMDLRIILVG